MWGVATGGVTTVADQPNIDPATTDGADFNVKVECAANACTDYGISGGVAAGWDPDSPFDRLLFALGEVSLIDSTGDTGIETDLLIEIVKHANEVDMSVIVHIENVDLFDKSVIEGDLDEIGRDADIDT